MNRDDKLRMFKLIKLKHSIRFVYLNLTINIDSFKEFYIQNHFFLNEKSPAEVHRAFTHYHFIELCKKWMIYPCLSQQEILCFFESEMKEIKIES